jgi:glycogen operon protein
LKLPLGAHLTPSGATFSVWSSSAERIWVCLFEEFDETARIELAPNDDGVFSATVPGIQLGQRYGLRADGRHDPANGLWFDPSKLLMDPYAPAIDYPYHYNALMAAPRWQQCDTAPMMPKAIVSAPQYAAPPPPVFRPGGLIYELNVRALTKLHPDVPQEQRGTIAALAHPAIIEHLTKLGVSAVELMPITAWIDERHLKPLGLRNAWGYNPVSFMALDPRLAPSGVAELRDTVAALRAAGIGVILDLVFNHTGESDIFGPALSLRGLDANAYYRRASDGSLVNDTGCGHTLACDHPRVRALILDSLRHFVLGAGVDGFRFDLAPILGRTAEGFDPRAETLRAIETDPVLADRILIAEPWDIGPGGYQLGQFSPRWLEWNDRYRDDIRRFWRGDSGTLGQLATRLAGSSDIFERDGAAATRTVNFIAAHDGMTLADLTAYERKHNEANGEDNRDGHDDNLSWNHGVEGASDDARIVTQRRSDTLAMLTTLLLSRGTIMLTAGDEFGRTQSGNNNAYAQDNRTTWLDWAGRDRELERYAGLMAGLRAELKLNDTGFLSADMQGGRTSAEWLWTDWSPMTAERWEDPSSHRVAMQLTMPDLDGRTAILINGDRRAVTFEPALRDGWRWAQVSPLLEAQVPFAGHGTVHVPGRSVVVLREMKSDG